MPTTAMMIEALIALRNDPHGVPADQFWQLVERFRADLVNQAFALLGNQEDAEDVAQAALAKAFRLLSSLKDPHKLGAWLRSINRHTALNVLRARKRSKLRPAEQLEENAAPQVTASGRDFAAVGRATTIEHVARAVDALPEHYREPIVLRYWEHLSMEQIAERLGLPEGTVKSRLARADDLLLEKLRRIWSEG